MQGNQKVEIAFPRKYLQHVNETLRQCELSDGPKKAVKRIAKISPERRKQMAKDLRKLLRDMSDVQDESDRLIDFMDHNEERMRESDRKWYQARVDELTALLDLVNEIPRLI